MSLLGRVIAVVGLIGMVGQALAHSPRPSYSSGSHLPEFAASHPPRPGGTWSPFLRPRVYPNPRAPYAPYFHGGFWDFDPRTGVKYWVPSRP